MKKEVIILRGPSGCGKSTLAHNANGFVVSADHFFEDHLGRYFFDPMKLGQAHAECMKRFLLALERKVVKIVVDNTNIHQWEWENYSIIAAQHGYSVTVIEFRPVTVDDIRLCIKRNTHRVPADIVARMCVEFENYSHAVVMPIRE